MERGIPQSMHETEGKRKIEALQHKIHVTQHNIETSDEIIAHAPSDAQRGKLAEKNNQRRHAVGSMKKEIRDVQQTMSERSREQS